MSSRYEPLWQPLARYADFRGRSRRSELVGFWLLLMLIELVRILIEATGLAVVDFHTEGNLRTLVWAAILCPTLALFVRRLHDTGRTGWWVLLCLPVLALNASDAFVRFRDPIARLPASELPLPINLAFGAALLLLMVLLFWDDDPKPNRYGPNPRHGEPGEAR